jgi:hypothetical protein
MYVHMYMPESGHVRLSSMCEQDGGACEKCRLLIYRYNHGTFLNRINTHQVQILVCMYVHTCVRIQVCMCLHKYTVAFDGFQWISDVVKAFGVLSDSVEWEPNDTQYTLVYQAHKRKHRKNRQCTNTHFPKQYSKTRYIIRRHLIVYNSQKWQIS